MRKPPVDFLTAFVGVHPRPKPPRRAAHRHKQQTGRATEYTDKQAMALRAVCAAAPNGDNVARVFGRMQLFGRIRRAAFKCLLLGVECLFAGRRSAAPQPIPVYSARTTELRTRAPGLQFRLPAR
jgi:hypothetical protein